jgi:carbonic anhydrase/acetyltransferase-like protein (isoleucine patch superfamily)
MIRRIEGGEAVLIRHQGKQPRIAESAYVAPNAVISGDVTVGEGSSIRNPPTHERAG